MADAGAVDVGPTGDRHRGVEGMCDCGVDGPARMPMAAVVEGCGDLGAETPTQYVARWTEVAVVARERGYLPSDSVVSFDDAGAVDAARPGIEDAVRAAVASEEDCSEDEAREKAAALVCRLDRRRRPAGGGGQGKRRETPCPTPLREVVEGSIEHEARWNRCAELVAERGLSMKAASLLFATTMFCFTKDLVCTMTRAQLMAMTGIRTPASFAAAVRELMGQSLLSPKDGAPRTCWYLGEGFWGGLLAGEELDTPVATLVRRRATPGPKRAGRGAGAENRTSVAAVSAGGRESPSTGIENRTSETTREGQIRPRAGSRAGDGVESHAAASVHDRNREGGKSTSIKNRTSGSAAVGDGREERSTGIENRTSGLRKGKTRVTVATFAAEELPRNVVGAKIAERLADYYGERGEYRIARARLRGLAARIRQDIEVEAVAGAAAAGRKPERKDRASVARAGAKSRCRWCSSAFDHPAARGDRGDGVCRGCDDRWSRDGPVQVGDVVDGIGKRLGRGGAG